MSAPPDEILKVGMYTLRYIAGTAEFKIRYNASNGNLTNVIFGYSDASWGDNKDTRRSTSGYCFFLNGAVISWGSRIQTKVALSTVEAEYYAMSEALQEAIWLRKLANEFGIMKKEKEMILYIDSKGAENFIDHPTSHRRTKHIEIRRLWIKEQLNEHNIRIEWIDTKNMIADVFTKPMPAERHAMLTQIMMNLTQDEINSLQS